MTKSRQEDIFATDKISASSKKNEIFEAYQELLAKVNDTKQVSLQAIKQKQDETILVQQSNRI